MFVPYHDRPPYHQAPFPFCLFWCLTLHIPGFPWLTTWMEEGGGTRLIGSSERFCGRCLVVSGQGPSGFLGETPDVTNSKSFCLVTFPREIPTFPVLGLKVQLSVFRALWPEAKGLQGAEGCYCSIGPLWSCFWVCCPLPDTLPLARILSDFQVINLLFGHCLAGRAFPVCVVWWGSRAPNTPYGRCEPCIPAFGALGASCPW